MVLNPYIVKKYHSAMERLVRQLTENIVLQLPKDREFYTPDDLYELDIPGFVTDRAILEMTRYLSESIVPPHSEWADMEDKKVQKAWDKFIDTIVGEVRMPASFKNTVFETAVGDVLDVIIQPRTAIPAIIFGDEKTLTKEQVEKRTRFVTVNQHLSNTLVRYLDKKGKTELTLENCKSVITRIDERLIKNYNPLNWTQLLEPLFKLVGPSIDTDLLRAFFEDKEMYNISRRFDYLNTSLNKTGFIEQLSAPDLLKESSYDDDDSTLFDVPDKKIPKADKSPQDPAPEKSELKKEENEPDLTDREEDEEPAARFDLYSLDKLDEDETETEESEDFNPLPNKTDIEFDEDEEEDDDSIVNSFHQRRFISPTEDEEVEFDADIEDVEEGGEDDVKPLHSIFQFDDVSEEEEPDDDSDSLSRMFEGREDSFEGEFPEVDEDPDDILAAEKESDVHLPEKKEELEEESEEEYSSLSSRFEISEKDIPKPESEEEAFNWVSEEPEEEEDDDGESPMWKAYMGEEDEDAADEDENVDEDGFIDEPIIDLTKESDDSRAESEKIEEWLKDDRDRFVESIFGGSDSAFDQALIDIAQKNEWKEASKYIEKEIFARNLVDMYDEAAVDFTDRLHTYFKEYQST